MNLENQTYVQQLENTVTGLEAKIDELVKENSKLSEENKNLKKFERFYRHETEKNSDDKPETGDVFIRPAKAIFLTITLAFSVIAFLVGFIISINGLPATGIMAMVSALFFIIACINARSNA